MHQRTLQKALDFEVILMGNLLNSSNRQSNGTQSNVLSPESYLKYNSPITITNLLSCLNSFYWLHSKVEVE